MITNKSLQEQIQDDIKFEYDSLNIILNPMLNPMLYKHLRETGLNIPEKIGVNVNGKLYPGLFESINDATEFLSKSGDIKVDYQIQKDFIEQNLFEKYTFIKL